MNPRYNSLAPSRAGRSKGSGTAGKGPSGARPSGAVNESSPSWGGLPGKTQPRSRSAGVRPVKTYVQSKGL